MRPDRSVDDLAERIGAGEESAEEELVKFYYPRVYAMALVGTRDREAAKDVAQEVMLSVLCSLRDGKLRQHAALPGYVCTTARHRIADSFRSHRKEVASIPGDEGPVSGQANPETTFEKAERLGLALEAIKRLSPKDQKILRLTLVEGLKPEEIAAKLGLSAVVVRKRKSRAVRRARAVLRKNLSRTET